MFPSSSLCFSGVFFFYTEAKDQRRGATGKHRHTFLLNLLFNLLIFLKNLKVVHTGLKVHSCLIVNRDGERLLA